MRNILFLLIGLIFVLWIIDFKTPCGTYGFTTKPQEMLAAQYTYNCPSDLIAPHEQAPWYAQIFNLL